MEHEDRQVHLVAECSGTFLITVVGRSDQAAGEPSTEAIELRRAPIVGWRYVDGKLLPLLPYRRAPAYELGRMAFYRADTGYFSLSRSFANERELRDWLLTMRRASRQNDIKDSISSVQYALSKMGFEHVATEIIGSADLSSLKGLDERSLLDMLDKLQVARELIHPQQNGEA